MVTARDDVEFVSAKWAHNAPNGNLETRLRVVGPLVNFDNIREQIQVIGPGRMLLEDYRARPKEQLRDHNTPAAAFGIDRGGQVMLTGRGATLLRWSGHLMLDAFHNDMRAETAVQMIHRSLDSQLTVQMDCQQLLADLEATGGLGVWFAGEAPQPQVKAVYADDAVRILSDEKLILTDHLEYTAYDHTVLLHADAGRLTQVQERDAPAGLTAQRVRWDLLKNRLEILNRPGAAHVPVD